MRSKLNKMSWTNRFILIALLLVGLSNPWAVGYIGAGVDTAVAYYTLYANYVFVAGIVLLGAVNIYVMYASREKVNIPKKSAKTPKVKFLED